MEDIIVHPGYQGKGMGKALVKKLLQESGKRGISIITVTFEEKIHLSTRAAAFLLALPGFGARNNQIQETYSLKDQAAGPCRKTYGFFSRSNNLGRK